MIILFGSAGSGKSTQGQLLAKKHGWKWLSSGEIFRSCEDEEIAKIIRGGNLVPDEITNKIVFAEIDKHSVAGEKGGVILDGYPRKLEQAKFLIDHNISRHNQPNINLAIMIDVDKDEVVKRMMLRGRDDDTPDEIAKRLAIYNEAIQPILDYFSEKDIPVVHVNGVGTIEEIHNEIESTLASYNLAK
jgi:adenylate kinase